MRWGWLVASASLRLSSSPVPATRAQRITAAELEVDQKTVAATADDACCTCDCILCSKTGGKRPATKEGRDGR